MASEIAVLRNLDGGHAPSTVDEFWRQLALDSGIDDPSDDIAVLARTTAETLGLEFDEDYVEQEGGIPALSLYEAILAVLQATEARRPTTLVEPDESDDDGEDTSVDLRGFIADVPAIGWTIRETVLSIGKDEVVLNPEWQRGFVWKLQKQRRLVESVLLGLPIPSFLFFLDSKTGKVFVIDGRQRLETIHRFMSPKEKKGSTKVRFRTFSSKTVGWGPGQPLYDCANRHYDDLPDPFRLKFERAALTTFTFKDIPPEQLYQIFKRYNTGAVALNAAEIRNAVYQASPLHGMMFRLAGEHGDPTKYHDQAESEIGEALHGTMPRGKRERYGKYDFIGRYFAFRYQETGSVAAATNTFMQRFGNASEKQIEELKQEFIRAWRKTLDWYEYPLIEPRIDGSFHAMLAAIQLVSTTVALNAIESGALTEAIVKERIAAQWQAFANELLEAKQNSTLFWASHRAWNQRLTKA